MDYKHGEPKPISYPGKIFASFSNSRNEASVLVSIRKNGAVVSPVAIAVSNTMPSLPFLQQQTLLVFRTYVAAAAQARE
jgi:hypothetical protein